LLRQAVHDWGEGSAAELPPARPILQAEVEPLLDYRGGIEQFHRNEKWRLDVIEHYRYNLYRMVQLCRDAKVPLLLVNPVSNLRDCPPFKSLHREDLTAEELEQFELLWTTAKRYFKSNKFLAAEYLEQAIALDDQFAGIYYELGNCYDDLGMLSRAKEAFLQAKELDVCPLRILEPMNEVVLEIARRTETPLVDVQRMFETLTDGGIPGNDWLLDHVHPSIFGHQQIAAALMKELIRQGVVRPELGWHQERERKFREHFTSLGDIYFAQGMQRLDNLRTWTEGRGFKTRPNSKETE
jgi:tetratricopeptide (TPR) repeat protein